MLDLQLAVTKRTAIAKREYGKCLALAVDNDWLIDREPSFRFWIKPGGVPGFKSSAENFLPRLPGFGF
jgi:hypothetical protein